MVVTFRPRPNQKKMKNAKKLQITLSGSFIRKWAELHGFVERFMRPFLDHPRKAQVRPATSNNVQPSVAMRYKIPLIMLGCMASATGLSAGFPNKPTTAKRTPIGTSLDFVGEDGIDISVSARLLPQRELSKQ